MKLAVVVLVLALSACTPQPPATARTSVTPSTSAPATPSATPVVSLEVNYLSQLGSHFVVWIDVTNRGAVPATGQPLVSLYWKELSIGKVCGPAIDVAAGATTRVKFERMNGPAAQFDHEDVELVPAC